MLRQIGLKQIGLTRRSSSAGGSAPDPALALLDEARIYIDWSDAADYDHQAAPNRNDPRDLSRNILAFPDGLIQQDSGQATPTRTPNYSGETDPSGETSHAVRLVTTAVNQVFYLLRPSFGDPALPVGNYAMRFRGKARSGAPSVTCSWGLTTALNSGVTLPDLDWSDPANDAATTFLDTTIAYGGSGDFWVRAAASGDDYLLSRIQLYHGTSAPPAWSDEQQGGRTSIAHENSLTLTASGTVDLSTNTRNGLWAVDPSFPDKHTYEAFTVMVICSADVPTDSSDRVVVTQHKSDGGAVSNGNSINIEASAPTAGELTYYVNNGQSVGNSGINIAGKDVFIAGFGANATEEAAWFDAIQLWRRDGTFAGQDIARWALGAFQSSTTSHLNGFQAYGEHAEVVVWDRLLDPDEFAAAAIYERARLEARATPVAFHTIPDFHLEVGDSNWTRGSGDFTQLGSLDGAQTGNNLLTANFAVGGKGLDWVERDNEGSEAGLPEGTITANGTWGKLVKPAALYGCEAGYIVLIHYGMGTNDWDIINSIGISAYTERVKALLLEMVATHENAHVMAYTLMPQSEISGRVGWESWRASHNPALIAWAATQSNIHICDIGGDADIGDPANMPTNYVDAGGGVYQHYNSVGDAKIHAVRKTSITAWRTALGIE